MTDTCTLKSARLRPASCHTDFRPRPPLPICRRLWFPSARVHANRLVTSPSLTGSHKLDTGVFFRLNLYYRLVIVCDFTTHLTNTAAFLSHVMLVLLLWSARRRHYTRRRRPPEGLGSDSVLPRFCLGSSSVLPQFSKQEDRECCLMMIFLCVSSLSCCKASL